MKNEAFFLLLQAFAGGMDMLPLVHSSLKKGSTTCTRIAHFGVSSPKHISNLPNPLFQGKTCCLVSVLIEYHARKCGVIKYTLIVAREWVGVSEMGQNIYTTITVSSDAQYTKTSLRIGDLAINRGHFLVSIIDRWVRRGYTMVRARAL